LIKVDLVGDLIKTVNWFGVIQILGTTDPLLNDFTTGWLRGQVSV
jgi:hypothetical protein